MQIKVLCRERTKSTACWGCDWIIGHVHEDLIDRDIDDSIPEKLDLLQMPGKSHENVTKCISCSPVM